MNKIRIATRSSELALKQAEIAIGFLQTIIDASFELIAITTKGDKILDRSLFDIGGKGLFTKEIEEALLDGRADIAIHSMKDVPSIVPEGLEFAAYIDDQDARDALIESEPGILQKKSAPIIGTSSLRRKYFALKLFPSAIIVDLRGNINSRIAKLGEELDATILAVAGLKRIGFAEDKYSILPESDFIPAICQGIIGMQIRSDFPLKEQIKRINNNITTTRVEIERQFLVQMNAGCKVPIAGHAKPTDKTGKKFLFSYFYKQEESIFQNIIEIDKNTIEQQISAEVKKIKDLL